MELQDLNVLAQKLQSQFKSGFNADDIELPKPFINTVKGFGDYSFSYKKHMVHMTSTTLDGYIPNAWFVIASYFVDYYNELQNYKEQLFKSLKESGVSDKSKRDEIVSQFPKLADAKYKEKKKTQPTITFAECQDEAVKEINDTIRNYLANTSLSENNKELLSKFVSDYRWWYGAKTIDRGDFYVSPILTLSNVVNASHSYIADLCKFLAEQKNVAALLRHPNAIIVETSLPVYFIEVFKHLYEKEDRLLRLLCHIVPGSKGSVRYAYDYNGIRQTNFFIKGEDNFNTARKGDFYDTPFIYKGEKYYLSLELAKYRPTKNEVSYFGLKSVIESLYPEYELLEESDIYILNCHKTTLR